MPAFAIDERREIYRYVSAIEDHSGGRREGAVLTIDKRRIQKATKCELTTTDVQNGRN